MGKDCVEGTGIVKMINHWFSIKQRKERYCEHPSGSIMIAWWGQDKTLRAFVKCDICNDQHQVFEGRDNLQWVQDRLRDYRKMVALLA